MRNFLSFLFLLIAIPVVYGQQAELHHNGQPVGSTFTIDSVDASIDHFAADFYIVNTGSTNIDISFSRTRKAHTNGWTDQVCDCLICFNATDITVWERPSSPPVTITPGDSCILQPKVYPNTIDGCAIYNYIVETSSKTFLDSIQVTYTFSGNPCVVGQNELNVNQAQFSVYPNPADDVLNVNATNLKGKATVTLYDIVGKEVLSKNLVNGNNTLNIEDLKSGVYFYSIKKENENIETKKIVIQ